MKKIIFTIVLITSTISVNALGFDFTSGKLQTSWASVVSLTDSLYMLVNGSSYDVYTKGHNVEETMTIVGSGVSFSHTNPVSTLSFKVYNTHIQTNSTNRVMKIATNPGDVVVIYTKAWSSGSATIDVTGGSPSQFSLMSSTPEQTTVTATGSQVTLTNSSGKYQVEKITINGAATVTNINNAIASSVLSKVNDELVNPTNLQVEVYSVMGAKVLTSSASSISVSGLASGFYVAKTAEGTLKFIK